MTLAPLSEPWSVLSQPIYSLRPANVVMQSSGSEGSHAQPARSVSPNHAATDVKPATPLLPPHAQRIRHPINIVKPRCNQRNLQDPAIIKPHRPQPVDIIFPTLGSVFGELYHILHHHSLL